MRLPIPYSGLLGAIGVAILAEVRAGVIFADILADDAAAELALAFILVVFLLYGIMAIIEDNGTFWNCIISEETGFHFVDFYAQELHQDRILPGNADHHVIIYAAIVRDVVFG